MPTQADIALAAMTQAAAAAPTGTQADRALRASIAPSATPEPSWMSQGRDFASAFGHHAMNLPHGLAMLVENTASGIGNAVAPRSRFVGGLTDMVDRDNSAMTQREADYQARTPNSAGAYAGAGLGEIAPMLLGAPARLLQGAGDMAARQIPQSIAGRAVPAIIPKVASGAFQGGLYGSAMPGSDTSSAGIGAGVMGAVPVVGGMARAGARALAPIFSPKSVVAPMMGRLAQTPEQQAALRSPQQFVPGSLPTTAQVLATPEAVATEKAFANRSPDFKNALLNRANANNEARLGAVSGVAQDDSAISAAIQARANATGAWTGEGGILANGNAADATPILDQLQKLRNSSLGTDPVVKKGVDGLVSDMQDSIAATGQSGNLVRPDLLDGHRQNVRNLLKQYGSSGAVSTKQEAAFEPVRSAIVDSIDGANPGYRDYLASYAAHSRPINTMEAARGILDNVGGAGRAANSAGDAQVTLGGYSTALRKALSGPYELDPAARSTLEGVQSDIQREGISNSIRTPGSDTAYNLQTPNWLARQLYGDGFSGTPGAAKVAGSVAGGLGGYFTGGVFGAAGGATAGAAAMNKIGQFGQERVNAIMTRALTDPEFAAQLAAQSQNTTPGLLTRAVPQLGLLQ